MTALIHRYNHIPYLDGLRGISILLVVTAHSGLEHVIPGGFGVTLFFFISGYLITQLLMKELQQTGSINLPYFYLRRFLRLYPPLMGMILAGLAFIWLKHCTLSRWNIVAACFYFTNYYIGWIRGTVPDCATIFDVLWSLSIEEHFYLLYPLLLLLLRKKIRTFIVPACVGLLCFVPLLCRWALLQSNSDFNSISGKLYLSTHTRADCILWGCFSALLLAHPQLADFYKRILEKKISLLTACLLLLASFCIRDIFFRETLRYTLQGIALLVLVPAPSFQKHFFLLKLLQSKWMVFTGKISYALYLFHWVALHVANAGAPSFSIVWQAIFWPLALLLTFMAYALIERPLVPLRRRFGSNAQQ
jgi:peptidoglycan/LPS O-acetylase OafA/YrhL